MINLLFCISLIFYMFSPSKGELEGDYGLSHQTGQAKTETECSNGTTLEQAIYNYLQQDQRDSLLLLLQCIDEEWTQKLLIGTYVDEGQYDLALAEMQKLDSTTTDNAEFIALCTAIMDSTLNTTPTEGGRLANVLQQTQHIANNTNSGNKIFAQSALALYQNADYVRHGEPINLKATETINNNTVDLNIIPNPSTGNVSFLLAETALIPQQLLLYDISGRIVSRITIPPYATQINVNLNHLQSGMYYCQIEGHYSTYKLVLIR